jgi:hypothetical protein
LFFLVKIRGCPWIEKVLRSSAIVPPYARPEPQAGWLAPNLHSGQNEIYPDQILPAWARLIGRQTCVVHGNPNNPGNVRMNANRVALIDWDEVHVDVPDLDLAPPHNAAGLDEGAHDIAAQASAAWEAAVCWGDGYAIKRLAEVRGIFLASYF